MAGREIWRDGGIVKPSDEMRERLQNPLEVAEAEGPDPEGPPRRLSGVIRRPELLEDPVAYADAMAFARAWALRRQRPAEPEAIEEHDEPLRLIPDEGGS